MTIAFIGYGTIARLALETIAAEYRGGFGDLVIVSKVGGASRARAMVEKLAANPASKIHVVTGLDELLRHAPQLVVEAAGHAALAQYGPPALRSGADLIIASVGALAAEDLRIALDEAAAAAGSTYELIPGAVGGLDILSAAKLSGIAETLYISRKPPAAWANTAADGMIDLSSVTQSTTFFHGNAGDAARLFPQNANVAATIALHGLGFEATKVELVADPQITRNVHELRVQAGSADFTIRIEGRPAPDNPKTSLTTAYSLAHRVMERLRTLR